MWYKEADSLTNKEYFVVDSLRDKWYIVDDEVVDDEVVTYASLRM